MKNTMLMLLKIWEILCRETDEDHPMGTETLRAKLEQYGYTCDRRAIYDCVELLNGGGYEVKCTRRASNEYFVVDRAFDVAELRILMDAVQAASFITPKKTAELIDKIAMLAGDKRAEVMRKARVEFHTPKSDNERIYYSVDSIDTAIERRRQISFLYFDRDFDHKRVYRKQRGRYVVNPLATVFSDDNYYLMCYDDKHDGIANYRIDRMDEVSVLDSAITEADFEFDLDRHKNQLFGMFNGEDVRVKFIAERSLINHIFDKFGDRIRISRFDEEHVTFFADVKQSPAFLGWCCSFGNKLRVVSPETVFLAVKNFAEETAAQYERG